MSLKGVSTEKLNIYILPRLKTSCLFNEYITQHATYSVKVQTGFDLMTPTFIQLNNGRVNSKKFRNTDTNDITNV